MNKIKSQTLHLITGGDALRVLGIPVSSSKMNVKEQLEEMGIKIWHEGPPRGFGKKFGRGGIVKVDADEVKQVRKQRIAAEKASALEARKALKASDLGATDPGDNNLQVDGVDRNALRKERGGLLAAETISERLTAKIDELGIKVEDLHDLVLKLCGEWGIKP